MHATLSVRGAVNAPATYSRSELAALPQTTVETASGSATHTVEGVSLLTLVNLAQPALATGVKNAQLRVTIAVEGSPGRAMTIALGELDPNFGNHPAILALERDGRHLRRGPRLVFPDDQTAARFVLHVKRITIAIQNPTSSVPARAGDLTVTDGDVTRVLSVEQLAHLRSHTRTVSFFAGTSPQTHTETGPSLRAVLAEAGVRTSRDTWVAAVASDNYVATVTPGEDRFGGRSLQISLVEDGVALAQPRLVVDGDVKGGRYVSGVTKLVVGEG
ncbi:MAG TPA: hypothetical protein VGO80_18505 [Solirubrobacteraceae bacterium]|nr:hypothetical protein [Solirubrobacteraceae bacterium]